MVICMFTVSEELSKECRWTRYEMVFKVIFLNESDGNRIRLRPGAAKGLFF